MEPKISKILKSIAILVLILSIIGGLAYFIISVKNYFNYKEFLDGASIYGGSFLDSYTEYGNLAYSGKIGITYSLIMIFSGVISFAFIYGFGEIISLLDSINDKISSNSYKKSKAENKPEIYSDSKADLLASANGNASTWTCKKCGKSNSYDKVYCPECGEYK
ncbi:hypothetical protein [Clostridium sp. KNHs205]|uniref:hypothetical protein n=1 Tax=Clostridium sp. KNHs205 TaxID=1449050 RepID=UPI00051AF363|nr:hypothetical protein [Clostridium sp. KNHs205]